MEDVPLTPLISVIVPVYNVERYVRKCLDSLKNQTMKQIEVICIDDGSTDTSGVIADEYESNDWPRFKVIHTTHGGLSAARNKGLDKAVSDWIMFVDSDDWVEPEFCRIPYRTAIKYHADMVIFQNCTTTEKGRIKKRQRYYIPTGMIDHETAIDVGGTAAWGRLYKKELFSNLRYPVGHMFEDYAITHQLVYRANRIICLEEHLYSYRYRKGSICHSVVYEEDRIAMSKARYEELVKYGYPEDKARAQLIGAALRCYGRIPDKKCSAFRAAMKTIENTKTIPNPLSRKEKCLMKMWRINESLYRGIYRTIIWVKHE